MDNINNASSQIPILGRPRGLVPAKNAAERMREYRQRKKNRNNNFKQNRLLKNNISTDQIIQVSEPLINNDAVIIAGPSYVTLSVRHNEFSSNIDPLNNDHIDIINPLITERDKKLLILGRPRHLVTRKNAAQRMREYRQRIKENRNSYLEQNRLPNNNINTVLAGSGSIKDNTSATNMGEKTTNLCRICLQEIVENKQYYFLNDNELMLQSKLLDILPEIDLNITPNPVACNECIITIKEIYEFKQLCIQTETTIRNLRQQGVIKKEFFDDNVKVEFSDLQIGGDDCMEMKEPSKTELYHCYNCDFSTDKKMNLIGHLIHRNVKTRMCKDSNEKPYSYSRYDGKTSLKNHKRKHIGEKLFKCNICDYCSNVMTNFKIHLRKHTGEKPFKCNICDYCSTCIGNLKKHILRHTDKKPKIYGKTFKCNICDYCNTNITKLKTHIRKHTAEKPFKCNICDNCSTNAENLKKHLRTHTDEKPGIREKPFKCNVCDYSSTTMTLLKTHMCRHTGERPFKCNICEYCSINSGNLKEHLRTHTGEKPFKCNSCDYCSNRLRDLNIHMRTHTGEKPFKCNICDYCSKRMDQLKIHMRQHTGEKPFKCSICAYCSTNMANLKKHLHTHSGEKPFKCNICEHCSTTKSGLETHMRKHTGEKPFKCNICNYRSSQLINLKMHMNQHTGEKPFKCNICDYCSIYNTNLYKHMRRHAGEK